MKVLESDNNRKAVEIDDLQSRLVKCERDQETNRKESFALKQKIVATEGSRDQAVREVGTQTNVMSI